MHEGHEVEKEADCVDAVVEDGEAALECDFHDQPWAPAQEKQDDNENQHLDHLLACFLDVPDVGAVDVPPEDEATVGLVLRLQTHSHSSFTSRPWLTMVTKFG